MDINWKYWNNITETERQNMFNRSESDISAVEESVKTIIAAVKEKGDRALMDYNSQFDKAPPDMPLKITETEFEEAETLISPEIKAALEYAIGNIRKFHEEQKPPSMTMMEITPGVMAGEKAIPLESVCLYVPRGRGSFPSMLYMLAVPAQTAGVKRICVTTPPDSKGKVDAACLVAARLCGVSEVYKCGGSQAIAAFAMGTKSIPAVQKITGPGSMYVAAAKRILSSKVDVGLPAGPSESLVLADSSANPRKTALDLLIESEHGSDSCGLLLTDSKELAQSVCSYINEWLPEMPEQRRKFVTDVLSGGYGGIVVTKDMNEAAEICNQFAPEHLEILTKSPFDTLSLIKNAGEILLGENTPFSLANYAIGPNAVLPTGGRATTCSAVSVRDFIKYSSVIYNTKQGYDTLKGPVTLLADYEGFYNHARALKARDED